MAGTSFATQGARGTQERMRLKFLSSAALAALLFLNLIACARPKPTAALSAQPDSPAPATSEPPVTPVSDSAPLPSIDAARAMQYTREIVAFGPRPVGSENHKKVEQYIHDRLKGDIVADDLFTADTPEGKFPVRNILAKFPGTKDGIIVIASHYDTNYPLRNTSFVGANDGASTSALLLEIANQLRGHKREGYSVWLLWDDAEEAIKPDTEIPFENDSLYGVRHLAETWQSDGTLKKIKAFLLADMLGDADLNILRETSSTPWLEDVVLQAASRYGYQSYFFQREGAIEDDHLAFLQRGVPSADLIDFDYGYNNVFWHTTQDTVDKLSPKSLQIAGNVILETVHMLDAR
jgi:glutaminyl-peptide cyclotransferase